MNLRKEAKGRDCYVRLAECLHDPETVVLAHWRGIGISGAGLKAADAIACPACFNCHELIDRRKILANLTREEARAAHADGIFRWQTQLVKEGKLKW